MMASGFLLPAMVLAASGSSQDPGTLTISMSSSAAPARFKASSAPASKRSVMKLLKRAHSTANFNPLASRFPSMDEGIMGNLSFSLILPHGSRFYPEFLDHRAHRPRQVDASRPPPGSHWSAAAARDDGAGAGHHGPGARARHHHQSACRATELQGRRRPDVSAQPDRHAGPRGFYLRSIAQPASL